MASLSLLAGLNALLGCSKTEPITEVVVSISSPLAVDEIAVMLRNIHYDIDRITLDVRGRDLVASPFTLQIRPTEIIKDRFLFYAQGLKDGEVLVAESSILEFSADARVSATLALRDNFVDADNDGFEPCLQEGCDCDDRNPTVNPFTLESCVDFVDRNCSGYYRENCECQEDDPPVPCSGLAPELRHLAGIGACYLGELRCVNGLLEEHCDYGRPQTEVVGNYIDDDCDGSVDEGGACDSPGISRPCHRGFVDDPNHPNPALRTAASDLALGECGNPETGLPFGIQTCTAAGVWGHCDGDVLPERESFTGVGWAERMANVALGEAGQCDGLDNDCDGLFDEEPYFDADGDGYTSCGTVFVPDPEDPRKNTFTQGGLAAEFIDCDDSNALINPGQMELCGNAVDEDCRCDHDPAGLPPTQAGSVIGLPYNRLDGGTNCAQSLAALNCSLLPRSDANPTGLCAEGPNTFYAGYFGPTNTDRDCYACSGQFGFSCDASTGSCTSKSQDCRECSLPDPPSGSALAAARPACTIPGGGCSNDTPPQWVAITGADPNGDCAAVACTGYYHGIINARCHEKADQSASQVLCKGGGECQTAADRCPQETMFKSQPLAMPSICQKAVSGCVGNVAPVYANQDNNEDLFEHCNSDFVCNTHEASAGGGPFYFGAVDVTDDEQDNPICFYAANVNSSFCNGSGACQSRVQACTSSGRGAAVGGRPLCQRPAEGSCTGTTDPSYTPVAKDSDPYNDCAGSLNCDGTGTCHAPQGGSCAISADCQSGLGLTCVDGVCCNAASCPTCQACNVGALAGSCQPVTANEGRNCQGACTECVAGTCIDRPLGDFAECAGDCVACNGGTAGTGTCEPYTGAEGKNCLGTASYCCAGVCNTPLGSAATEFGSPCGSGDCQGIWSCNATAARCSAFNNGCDSCSGDRRILASCTDSLGTQCSQTAEVSCPACSSCVDEGATTSCAPVGGVHDYSQFTDDVTTPNLCNAAGGPCGVGLSCTCDGAGGCWRANGEGCENDGQCASEACVDGVCCAATACDTCERCDVSGSEGVCTAITAASGNDCTGLCEECLAGSCVASAPHTACGTCQECDASGVCAAVSGSGPNCAASGQFCCAGDCTPAAPGAVYGDSCGGAGCGGVWACADGSAQCSAAGAACERCGSAAAPDQIIEGVCGGSFGLECLGTATDCPVCTQCVQNAAAAACQIRSAGTEDTDLPNLCSTVDAGCGDELACACDGDGPTPACKRLNGQQCGAGEQCLSGSCVGALCADP